MEPLIAVILTKNEAENIADCVADLRSWVDTVVVWDSGSEDGTQALARQAGALVVERPFDNFANQRQAVLETVEAEWILFIDADERATPAFADEVCANIKQSHIDGFWVPRRNFIVGNEMRFGGYYPDYQLRLFRRKKAQYDRARTVHELVQIDGEVGHLQEPLIHYNYVDWEQFHAKQQQYVNYEAKILAERGIRPRPHNFVLQPLREFSRRALWLQGWRDGVPGLQLALLYAWYYGFMPYWLLWRREVE